MKSYKMLLVICLVLGFRAEVFAQAGGVSQKQGEIIIDSDMDLDRALSGISLPAKLKMRLELIDVTYYSFDGRLHKGQLVADRDLSSDIRKIFEVIRESKFPVEKVIPVSAYKWSDSLSMADNNTSCFNYRVVRGTKILSLHAKGRAIDINPRQNPAIKKGKTYPAGSSYNVNYPGTVHKKSDVVSIFEKKGWEWGGRWRSMKDYQHFQKK